MCHSINLPKDFVFIHYFTRNEVIFLMSKWWPIYKTAAMNTAWSLHVCSPPKGSPLPGTSCCFAVRRVKHAGLTVGRLEKKETVGWGTTVKNHSDVFLETSSILKIKSFNPCFIYPTSLQQHLILKECALLHILVLFSPEHPTLIALLPVLQIF